MEDMLEGQVGVDSQVELKQLMLQSIQASEQARAMAEHKAIECEKQTLAYQEQTRAYQEQTKQLESDIQSRDELTKELEEQNRIANERLAKAEEVLEIIRKIFIIDRTLEVILAHHKTKLDDIDNILLKLTVLVQLQVSKVIETLVLDDKTRKDYNQIIATLDGALRRSTDIVASKTEVSASSIQTRDIIGEIK